jgi:predicted dehydrogenase
VRGGALAEELNYFAQCVLEKRAPEYITPQESMDAVVACLAAEKSAALGRTVRIDEML